ncbi:class I SAM-dependent methyltransferase [Zavarzinia compransoris]|uniref:class I SAM-dependent methyltransferase n=1 Tax=Zavarzinia marina TaxID=2911065 RepID=UPI001F46510B|nr:class I SAM-dependent methyltransferase [Zavarzinia marina]MCF4164721.1 class I SAM-dependent methyltransferase [Zavarzinia marina]
MSIDLTGVPETLLIPLYAQWRENRRSRPLIKDPSVDDIVARLDPPFDKFVPSTVDRIIVILRKKIIDGMVKTHLSRHRGHAVVINLGCGLCTRFARLDDGGAEWFDIDLAEVEPFWRAAFPHPGNRRHFVRGSINDLSCLDRLPLAEGAAPIIVMEGVSMYLSEAQMRTLVTGLARRFPGAHFIFDAMASWVAMGSAFYPSITVTGARFTWGLDRPKSCQTWGRGIRLLRDEPIARHLNALYGPFGWLWRLNPLVRGAYRVVALRLGRKPAAA